MIPPASEAARIVSELTGSRIRDARRIEHGVMTFKYQLDTDHGERYMARFYPPGREAVVECEPGLLARCRAAGLPVPEVIGDSRSGPRAPLNYVVYRAIDGEMLSHYLMRGDQGRSATLAQELADLLAALAQVSFDGFGELSGPATARHGSWTEFVAASWQEGLAALERGRLVDVGVIASIRSIAGRAGLARPVERGQLAWGDISFDNILVDRDGAIAGLIDFESCLSGDPLATLGYAYAAHGHQPFCEAVIHASGLSPRDHKSVLFYTVLRGLRLAPYLHKPLPTGHARDHLFQIFPAMLPALAQLTSQP